jgi:hypothetical protein
MTKRLGLSLACAILLPLQACAGLMPLTCGPGLMQMTQAQLFFGRDIERRAMVSDEQWRDFLDQEVTPRFTDGFSVSDVAGQYRDQSGAVVREPSKQLLIFMRNPTADEPKLNAIRDAYKRRFNQESVLLVQSPVCAGF